ncbi:hypothetical protein [Streptomyces sp. 8N706]|uniref:hypothetical protein n=1 Tax=Streptomyces sp. 8N706 TaxID=3457416 RepID=UPI003FD54099
MTTALIAALSGLLGTLCGSLLTGYLNYRLKTLELFAAHHKEHQAQQRAAYTSFLTAGEDARQAMLAFQSALANETGNLGDLSEKAAAKSRALRPAYTAVQLEGPEPVAAAASEFRQEMQKAVESAQATAEQWATQDVDEEDLDIALQAISSGALAVNSAERSLLEAARTALAADTEAMRLWNRRRGPALGAVLQRQAARAGG